MSERESIQPTYDHRETGDRFTIDTWVADRPIEIGKRLPDPFVTHTVTIGWPDLLRGLLHGSLRVRITVGGDDDVVEDICELDANYLGTIQSSRRREWRASLQHALSTFPEEESVTVRPSGSPHETSGT